ncbi:MAG: TetR/AcrR family transcriptional regulator [Treponemataceae bacterium]
MKLFTEKGFSHTTMENIINETGLSKGGFYHYYNSTSDILYDLMKDGIEYRNQVIKSKIGEFKNDEIEFMAERFYEKIVDDNPYMGIYIEFLLLKSKNPRLKTLFKILKEKTRKELFSFFEKLPNSFIDDEKYTMLTDFINSLILGAGVLDARKGFIKNRALIIKMIHLILDSG